MACESDLDVGLAEERPRHSGSSPRLLPVLTRLILLRSGTQILDCRGRHAAVLPSALRTDGSRLRSIAVGPRDILGDYGARRARGATTSSVLNHPACGSPGSLSTVSLDRLRSPPAQADDTTPGSYPGNPDTAEQNLVDNVAGFVRGLGSQAVDIVTGVVMRPSGACARSPVRISARRTE